MGITITRYEPRNGPPQWVLCVDGQVERISESLAALAHDIENGVDREQDPDSPRA